MITETETTATTPGAHILQRCVALLLACGHLGNQRKVELGAIDMSRDGESLNGEKDELGATKKLFASKDLRPCQHAMASVKHRLRALSVDGGLRIFGPGCYLIPSLGVSQAEAELAQGQALVAQKARELAALLPTLIEQRRAKLGKMFVASDYPTASEVEAAYSIDWSYVSFGAPERLEEVDAAAHSRAVASWDAKLSDAYTDVIVGLRQSALAVMRDLAERLKPGEDGKPKVLRATALRDLQELLQHLPVLNSVGRDGNLAGVLARVGGYAQGLTVETLRDAPAIRGMLLQAAEAAVTDLGALVSEARRGISFENV